MYLFTSKLLNRLGLNLIKVSKLFYTHPQEARCIPWFRDNGDKTLRLNYDLNKNSIVFDLGGYEGQWSSDIFSKYCCVIHIFEPVLQYANNIESRFSKNSKIFVHKFGLSNQSLVSRISINLDSSSLFYENNKDCEQIQLIKASDFIKNYSIEKIDLIKVNIEGGEYDLLEFLIDSNYIEIIDNIQVQFHDFIPDAEERMKNIHKKLQKTHSLTWQYPFVWENWQLKSN